MLMKDQETYDHTLDAPAPAASVRQDEDYYRRSPEPRHGRGFGLGIALVLVGLLLLAFQLVGRSLPFGNTGSTTLVDKTLPGSRLELTAAASDVEVRPWNGPGIRVVATQHGGSQGDYSVDVSQVGDTVRVAETNRNFFCFFCSRDLSYSISVPGGAQADIKTSSGAIDVAGLGGAVALGSVSGDVQASDLSGGLTVSTTSGETKLRNIAGKLDVSSISGDVQLRDGKVDGATVKTTSGELSLEGVGGPLNLSSVSGDITVQAARDSQIEISTTSGDVEYTGALARSGSNNISSISGDVTLRLPADSGFQLDASSVSGSMQSDFDLRGGESGLRTLAGTAGAGGPTLTIGTTNGEIKVERQ